MPSQTMPARRTHGRTLYLIYVVALAVALTGNLLIRAGIAEGWLPQWGLAALAIAVSLPLGAAALLFWRLIRRDLDELLQRIVLEGMAFALTVYVPLAALYTNLRSAGVHVPRIDAPELVLAPALLVAIGVAIAARRYQ